MLSPMIRFASSPAQVIQQGSCAGCRVPPSGRRRGAFQKCDQE
jgi:hypothetical protein